MAEHEQEDKPGAECDIAKTALYEFTKSFLLSGKKAFINLDGNSDKMKYVDAFGTIVGGVVGFVVPGTSKAAAFLSKKPFDYGDKKIQKTRKNIFLSILNSDSKYVDDNFQRLFIERGISVFLAYGTSLQKLNCKAGKGDDAMANKRRALQKLGKYAGSICLENIIESESTELEKLLETLRTPSKMEFILSWYHKVKKPKFYFFLNESDSITCKGPTQGVVEQKKKHITVTDVFLKKFPQLYEQGAEAPHEEFWYLSIEASDLVEMTSAAISTDRKFFHALTLLVPIQDMQVNLKEIQKKLDYLAKITVSDPALSLDVLLDHETELTWNLKENCSKIKLLSESIKECSNQESLVSQLAVFDLNEQKRESLKQELEQIIQKIIELKDKNPTWDAFHTQNMHKSNNDALISLFEEINQRQCSVKEFLRSSFTEKHSKIENIIEDLRPRLALCTIKTVTNLSSLECLKSTSKIIIDELAQVHCELQEINRELLALQEITLCTDITTSPVERLLTMAELSAQINQKDIKKLSGLVDKSQSLQQAIVAEIENMELKSDPLVLNDNVLEYSLTETTLLEKVEDQILKVEKLDVVVANILGLAPSFEITSGDVAIRLQNLHLKLAIRIEKLLQKQETDLARDLNENMFEIKLLTEGMQEYNDSTRPFRDTILQLKKLKEVETKRESLKNELEKINQKIMELKMQHSTWDTFYTQNMLKSNSDALYGLAEEINETANSLNDYLRTCFFEKYSKMEQILENVHSTFELYSITKVTDLGSLNAMRQETENITPELMKLSCELSETKKELLALQDIQLCVDVTTFSFERSLAKATKSFKKNCNNLEQLLELVEESSCLQKIIVPVIEELERKCSTENNSLTLVTLQKKVEDESKSEDMQKLCEVNDKILALAPSFIASNDIVNRLENLRVAISSQIKNHFQIRWSNKICGFLPRSRHAAVAAGNKIYSFGGVNEIGHETYSRDGPLDVLVLNVDEGPMEWKFVSVKNSKLNPNQRYGHSAVAHKEFVLIFGGQDTKKKKYSNSTYRFNTQKLKWDKPKVTGTIPEARDAHSSVVIRNQMVIFGGYNENIKLIYELHSLDLHTFQWSIIQTNGIPQTYHFAHSATVYEDRFMLIFGGWDSENFQYVNKMVSFDFNNRTWTEPKTNGTPPSIRSRHCAFMHNGLMYIFGGVYGDSYLKTLISYDPETLEWKHGIQIGDTPAPASRAGAECVALNHYVYIFGGEQGSSTYLDDTYTCVPKI